MKTKTLITLSLIIILITGGTIYGQGDIRQENERGLQETTQEHRQEFKRVFKQPNIPKHNINTNLDTDNNKNNTSTITPTEHKLLIKITYLEARGESMEGKTAVVRTILNRVESKDFPNSIEEVVFQPGQFQPAKYLEEVEVEEEYLVEIEEAILKGFKSKGEELYFVNPDYADQSCYSWMKNSLTFLYKEGNHEFYK